MRRALLLAGLAAALATPWFVVRGQDRARDLSAVVVPLATRESSASVKSFNDRKFKDLTPLFTADAQISFLQGSSIEKLQYGMVDGREEIVDAHEMLCSIFPDA